MRFNYSPIFFALLTFVLSPKLVSGQVLDTIYGCDFFPDNRFPGSYDCMLCSPEPFIGTTEPFLPANTDFQFCGTIENNQFFGFVAGDRGFASFIIIVDQCTFGSGIQASVYDDEGQLVADCYDQIELGTGSTYTFSNLVQGEVYYLMVDGFSGDICTFMILPVEGFGGIEDIDSTPIVVNDNGTTQVNAGSLVSCLNPNATDSTVTLEGCLYERSWSIVPDLRPFRVFQQPNFVEFTWPPPQPQRVEVFEILDLVHSPFGRNCDSTLLNPFMSHFLDLDETASPPFVWPCFLERGVYELKEEAIETIRVEDTGVKAYLIEAAGYYGGTSHIPRPLLSCYVEDAFGNFVDFTQLGRTAPSDTLLLDFSNGPLFLEIENFRDWTIEFALNKLDVSIDTFRLNPITIALNDSVEIFQQIDASIVQVVDSSGTYQASFNCAVYIQDVLVNTPLSTINLGDTTLCLGDCLLTPTGEQIACTDGDFSFTSTANVLYEGNLTIDDSQPFQLQGIDYTCDSTTGQWFINLSWTGSTAPYRLNGQLLQSAMGQAGPFPSGQTIDISLAGASSCVDTLFINGSYSCTSNVTSIQTLGFEIRQLSSSLLEINAPSYGWQLHLIDILGREVLSTPLQQAANQLLVGDLLPGTYFLVVENGKERVAEKWVKQ